MEGANICRLEILEEIQTRRENISEEIMETNFLE